MHICDICKKRLNSRQALLSHKRMKHFTIPTEEAKSMVETGKKKDERISQLETERELSKCPECGKQVDWSNLPIKKYKGNEIKESEQPLFSILYEGLGKVCPLYGHFEEYKD